MATVQPVTQPRIKDEEMQEFVQGRASSKWRRNALVCFGVLATLTAQSLLTAGLVLAMVRAGNVGGIHVGKDGVLESASDKPVATAAAVEEDKINNDQFVGLTLERAKSLRSVSQEYNGTWSVYHVASLHKMDDHKIHLFALDGTEIVIGRHGITKSGKGGRKLGPANREDFDNAQGVWKGDWWNYRVLQGR